jgi:DNA-binding NarL/FixJ family response regulator
MGVVLRGEVWARRMHINYLVEALSYTHPSMSLNIGDRHVLSKREEKVVRLVAAGLTDRQIGSSLRLNEKGTKNYVAALLDKLGLSSRSELMFLFYAWKSQPFEYEKADVSKKDPAPKRIP